MLKVLIIFLNLAIPLHGFYQPELPSLLIKIDDPTTASNASAVEPSPANCEPSLTTVKGKTVCRGQLIFKDYFDIIDSNKWRFEVRIPTDPDYEFVTYVKRRANSFTKEGILHLEPTLLSGATDDGLGHMELEGCTAARDRGECVSKSFRPLPPVLSPRLRTSDSFSFRYGEVKIRAKLPKGDWIYPIVWLEPMYSEYGMWYASGRMVLANARGNAKLGYPGGSMREGSHRLRYGCLYWPNNTDLFVQDRFMSFPYNDTPWSDNYHTFTMKWTPDSVSFKVNGIWKTTCKTPNRDYYFKTSPWIRGSLLAPFDKEFYITLGVAVGGAREFPDAYVGAGNETKPWKNSAAKAVQNFWKAKSDWMKSWKKTSETALKVDSIEVYAL